MLNAVQRPACAGAVTRHVMRPVWTSGWMNSSCTGSPAVLRNAIVSVVPMVMSPGSMLVAPMMIVLADPTPPDAGGEPPRPAHAVSATIPRHTTSAREQAIMAFHAIADAFAIPPHGGICDSAGGFPRTGDTAVASGPAIQRACAADFLEIDRTTRAKTAPERRRRPSVRRRMRRHSRPRPARGCVLPRREPRLLHPDARLRRGRARGGGVAAADQAEALALPAHRGSAFRQPRVRRHADALPAVAVEAGRFLVSPRAVGLLRRHLRVRHRPVRARRAIDPGPYLAGSHEDGADHPYRPAHQSVEAVRLPVRSGPGRLRRGAVPDQRGLFQRHEGSAVRPGRTADHLLGRVRHGRPA